MVACPLPISVCSINRNIDIGSVFRYDVSVKVFQFNVRVVKQGGFCDVERNFIKFFIGYQVLATFDVYLAYCHAVNRCSDDDFLFLFSEDYLFSCVGNFIPNFYFSGWKFHLFKCFKVCGFSLAYIDLCGFLNIGFCILVGFKYALGSHQILTGLFYCLHLHNCCFIYFFHLFIIKLLNFVCIGNFIIHILNSNILCHSFVRLTFTALGSIYCTFNL